MQFSNSFSQALLLFTKLKMIGNLKEKVLSNATKLSKAKVNAIIALKALPPKTFTKKQKHEVKSHVKVPLKQNTNESKELSEEDIFKGSGLCVELSVPAEEFLEKVSTFQQALMIKSYC